MDPAIKANLAKVRDAKPRVLASSATFDRHEGPKIAGLPKPVDALCMEMVMTTNLADIVVHVDETLPRDQLKTLEKHIHGLDGVVSACNQDDQPHLICVVYNPDTLKSDDILEKVEAEGVHAEVIGL